MTLLDSSSSSSSSEFESAKRDLDLFFADRVLRLDQEVLLFSKYLSTLRIDPTEVHNLEWRLKEINEETYLEDSQKNFIESEILKFQKAVDEAQRDLNNLKRSKQVRDTQIRRLSQLSFPVEHDTTYLITDRFPMRKDDDVSKDSEGTCHQSYKVKMARGIDRNEVKKTRSIRQSAKTGEISKLERLVSSETSAAASLAQELRAQLDGIEGERLHRRVRDKEVKKNLSAEARNLILELHKSEMQCCLGVAELLKLRLRMLIEQREDIELMDQLQVVRYGCSAKIAQLQQELAADIAAAKRKYESDFNHSNREFSEQLTGLAKQIKMFKRREMILMKSDSKINLKEEALTSQLAASKERFNQLLRRHALDLEGYHSEAVQLRSKLKHLETSMVARERRARHREEQPPSLSTSLRAYY
eukprot:gene24850-33338_t